MERVIIVDDELLFQEALAKRISKLQNTEVVGKFENGLQAQKYLTACQNVTIAFVDISMPVMDGLELAQWISEHAPATKVVLISAYQDFQYAQKAIRANVYHYLTKPLKTEELETVFADIVSDRKKSEKSRLFNRDLGLLRKDMTLYHSVLAGERSMYRADWSIKIEDAVSVDLSDEMILTVVRNVIRYCRPSVSAVVSMKDHQIEAILLATDKSRIPPTECFETRAQNLLNIRFAVTARYEGSSDKKSENLELDHVIQDAISYIKKNLSANISREDVAEHVYMSPSHFSRFFKKKMNISFQDYLKKVKIECVIELIQQGRKIQDAYLAAGFQNKNYFNEVFRKEVGCSPSEYKKKLRKMENAK